MPKPDSIQKLKLCFSGFLVSHLCSSSHPLLRVSLEMHNDPCQMCFRTTMFFCQPSFCTTCFFFISSSVYLWHLASNPSILSKSAWFINAPAAPQPCRFGWGWGAFLRSDAVSPVLPWMLAKLDQNWFWWAKMEHFLIKFLVFLPFFSSNGPKDA